MGPWHFKVCLNFFVAFLFTIYCSKWATSLCLFSVMLLQTWQLPGLLILFIMVGKGILKHVNLCMLYLFMQELLDISEKLRKALLSKTRGQIFIYKLGNKSCQLKLM